MMVLCFCWGFSVRGTYNKDEIDRQAKQEFFRAFQFGINSGMIIVNRDRLPTNSIPLEK